MRAVARCMEVRTSPYAMPSPFTTEDDLLEEVELSGTLRPVRITEGSSARRKKKHQTHTFLGSSPCHVGNGRDASGLLSSSLPAMR